MEKEIVEKLVFLHLWLVNTEKQMSKNGISSPLLKSNYILDVAMDIIGYPPDENEYDSIYNDLIFISPPLYNDKTSKYKRLEIYQLSRITPMSKYESFINFLYDEFEYNANKIKE